MICPLGLGSNTVSLMGLIPSGLTIRFGEGTHIDGLFGTSMRTWSPQEDLKPLSMLEAEELLSQGGLEFP